MTDNENKTRTVSLVCHMGSEVGKDCYVGSTVQSLTQRLSSHRSVASRPGTEKNKLYRRMGEVGLKNWVIRPLETATCSEYEIRKLERTWCEALGADLNSILPIRWEKKRSEECEEKKETVRTVYLLHSKNSKSGKDSYVGSTSQSLANAQILRFPTRKRKKQALSANAGGRFGKLGDRTPADLGVHPGRDPRL